MKKILLSLSLIICSLSGFSQSFLADSKSISVPRYANQAAITTAIPSPVEGMLVYNNTLDQFVYYTGTVWTNFPSSNSSPWTLNTTTNRAVTNSGAEINRSSSTLASPDLFFRSPTTNIRMAGATGEAGFLQTATINATPASASVNFVHLNSAATPVQTPMMTINGNGNLTVNGFTKLGGTGTDVPAIKTKLLTGTISSGTGNFLLTQVAHGLNAAKIISIECVIGAGVFGFVSGTSNSNPSTQFTTFFNNTNVTISRLENDATSNLDGQGYKVYVTYTE
ncbi:MAG: hypothetical protein U5M51_02800 [Emticicia sp.]|nr:hypothetical protein [Emticicia sp.]